MGRPMKPEGHRPNDRRPGVAANGTRLPATVNPQTMAAPRPLPPVCTVDLGSKGQEAWDKVWDAGHWLKPDQDYHLVTMLAQAYDELEAYQAKIAEDGLMVRGSAGGVVAHGLIREVRQTRAQIIKILSMLGFSPTDRMRLGIAEVNRANALLDLKAKAARNAGR